MEEIKGLTSEEVQKRVEEGKVNNSNTNNLKSNWQIVRDNVCTLFNLFNLIIAIALACVHAYTNMVFILIIIINVLIGIIQEIHGKNLVKKLSILTVAKTKVIKRASITATANNLLLFTNYNGDPEVAAAGSGAVGSSSVGIDYCGVPATASFAFGVNLTF